MSVRHPAHRAVPGTALHLAASAPSSPAAPGTVADLTTGDRLISLGGVGFAQMADASAAPVLVCDVRESANAEDPADAIATVITSAGTLYARMNAPAQHVRVNTVTRETILLIGRRRNLHASLLAFGVPIVRRTPVADDQSAKAVTPTEWATAPLIVFDGYLAGQTLTAMRQRGLADRQETIMVGDDPDDTRLEGRRQIARARLSGLLPHDAAGLTDLFLSVTGRQGRSATVTTYYPELGNPVA